MVSFLPGCGRCVSKVCSCEHKPTFVDLQPYKSCQHFRLVLSSKFADIGKRSLNILLKENKIMEESLISQDIFNATLVSLPALKNNDGLKCAFCPLSFSSDIKSSVKIVADVGVHEQRKKMKLSNVKTGRDAGKLFPRLISYFENHVAKSWPTVCNGHSHIRESPNARIYKIIYYDQENPILVLAIASNNYCLNVQRRHSKNNIFLTLMLGNFAIHKSVTMTCVRIINLILSLLIRPCFFQQSKSEIIIKFVA